MTCVESGIALYEATRRASGTYSGVAKKMHRGDQRKRGNQGTSRYGIPVGRDLRRTRLSPRAGCNALRIDEHRPISSVSLHRLWLVRVLLVRPRLLLLSALVGPRAPNAASALPAQPLRGTAATGSLASRGVSSERRRAGEVQHAGEVQRAGSGQAEAKVGAIASVRWSHPSRTS